MIISIQFYFLQPDFNVKSLKIPILRVINTEIFIAYHENHDILLIYAKDLQAIFLKIIYSVRVRLLGKYSRQTFSLSHKYFVAKDYCLYKYLDLDKLLNIIVK